jgi:hypothetical protein
MYIFYQDKVFNEKYQLFFQQARSWGWYDTQTYLKALMMKEYGKMSIVEKMMYDDMKEMEHMVEEMQMVEESMKEMYQEPKAPFPLVGKFKERFLASYHYAMKFRQVKFADTRFCPRALPEESFDDRLRKMGVDPDEEIRKCKYLE